VFGAIIIAFNFLPEIFGIFLFVGGMLFLIIGITIYSYIIYYNERKGKK
jgi:hypothetical protein